MTERHAPPEWTAGLAASVTGGRVAGDAARTARGWSADSRAVAPGQAFVAVRGGHDFVRDALRAGAAFALAEHQRMPAALPSGTIVLVDDTVAALAALARHARAAITGRVVAVTGSTGKTTTRDMIAAAAATCRSVHVARQNFNTEVGLPLTLLACPAGAEVVVVELGARHAGEIGELAEIAAPEVGVVTGIGLAHIAEFGDRDTIARTKSELLERLPSDGLGIVPSIDDYLHVLSDRCVAPLVTVGPGGVVPLRADGTMVLRGRGVRIAMPAAVPHLLRNAAMAVVAAVHLGVDPGAAASAVATAPTTQWRMEVTTVGQRTIINDTYNSNPTSLRAALRALVATAGGRPAWALIGGMAELGHEAAEQHARLGRLASSLPLDRVVGIGPAARAFGVDWVADPSEALSLLAAAPHDVVVLVKGSRVLGLEKMVAQIAALWEPTPAGSASRAGSLDATDDR